MSKLDYSDSSLVLHTLREVTRFYQTQLQGLQAPAATTVATEAQALSPAELPDEAFRGAVDLLYPLAHYLQRTAPEPLKERLGDSIANDPDLIGDLYEGILMPFCQAISGTTGTPRVISSTNQLEVIRLLQVCLMEWTCSQTMKEKMVKSGCLSTLFTELRNLTSTIHLSSNQFAQHLIQTATLVISNCLSDSVDLYMRLHPQTDVSGALTPYFKCPNPTVQLVCKMTYYLFSYYLQQSSPGSVDCPDDLGDYTRLLYAASQSPEFVVMKGRLFLDATELLKLISRLCISEKNRLVVASSDKFPDAAINLLREGGEKEIECMFSLLLGLFAEGNLARKQPVKGKGKKGRKEPEEPKGTSKGQDGVKELLLSRIPKLGCVLRAVQVGPHSACKRVQELCSAVLWYTERSDVPENDIPSSLAYVECCYKYGHYEECCHWADYIREKSPGEKATFLVYKGKAMFHLYQQKQVLFRRSEKYVQDVAEFKSKRESVYLDTAKEIIKILAPLKSHQAFDNESERFLDFALMDYIRELNKQPDIRQKIGGKHVNLFYCMLCHEKQEIQRSHIVPEAILRAIFKEDVQLFKMGPSGLPLDYQPSTFKKQSFYMLCKKCDNVILSRDERPFVEEIVKLIYDISSPGKRLEQYSGLPYGEWLYRFCSGLVFRGLALVRGITASANEEELYKLFEQCRAVVQSVQTSKIPLEQLPTIAMFFTPAMLQEDSLSAHTPMRKLSNLVRTLNDHIIFNICNVPLTSMTPSVVRKRHFFFVHFGIFTIVAPFGPMPPEYRPFLVNPCSGVLNIPANDDRLDLNPPGLQTAYEEHTHKAVKQYIEKVVEEDKEVSSGRKKVSIMVVKSDSAELQCDTPHTFSLLPQGFVINRETNTVTTKQGHHILLHHTHQLRGSALAGHTLFLAAELTTSSSPSKPYVVIHTYIDPPKSLQNIGYYVSPHDLTFKGELDQNHKTMMKALRVKDLDLFKAPSILLPDAFARAGICNYQSFLLHFNRTSMIDCKCRPGDGCWFCSDRCDMCMQASKPGFVVQTEDDLLPRLRFCGEECKSFLGPSHDFARFHKPVVSVPEVEVTFTFVSADSEGECTTIAKATHLLHTNLPICEALTLAVIDVYRVEEGEELKPGCLFTLFHLKDIYNQVFSEFYLTEECRLDRPFPHVKNLFDDDLITQVNGLLQEGIKQSGHDVQSLISLGSHAPPTKQTRVEGAMRGEDDDSTKSSHSSVRLEETVKLVIFEDLDLGQGMFSLNSRVKQAGEEESDGVSLGTLNASAETDKGVGSSGHLETNQAGKKEEKEGFGLTLLDSPNKFEKKNEGECYTRTNWAEEGTAGCGIGLLSASTKANKSSGGSEMILAGEEEEEGGDIFGLALHDPPSRSSRDPGTKQIGVEEKEEEEEGFSLALLDAPTKMEKTGNREGDMSTETDKASGSGGYLGCQAVEAEGLGLAVLDSSSESGDEPGTKQSREKKEVDEIGIAFPDPPTKLEKRSDVEGTTITTQAVEQKNEKFGLALCDLPEKSSYEPGTDQERDEEKVDGQVLETGKGEGSTSTDAAREEEGGNGHGLGLLNPLNQAEKRSEGGVTRPNLAGEECRELDTEQFN